MPKDTGEFIISKSMNLRLPPIFGVYRVFVYSPTSPVFAEPVTYIYGQTRLHYPARLSARVINHQDHVCMRNFCKVGGLSWGI